ncbi:MAG: hypothetical protein ONB05_08160 [candidate division KSB1 bacterium]|nr:hypothetical protein [candidate division KSB1 bacterium]
MNFLSLIVLEMAPEWKWDGTFILLGLGDEYPNLFFAQHKYT